MIENSESVLSEVESLNHSLEKIKDSLEELNPLDNYHLFNPMVCLGKRYSAEEESQIKFESMNDDITHEKSHLDEEEELNLNLFEVHSFMEGFNVLVLKYNKKQLYDFNELVNQKGDKFGFNLMSKLIEDLKGIFGNEQDRYN